MRKKSLFIAGGLCLIDQIIKILINNFFSYAQKITLIPHFLFLTKVYNTGAAWSILTDKVYLLIIIALIALAFLLNYQPKFVPKIRTIIGFACIYGGLIGNLFDRIIRKWVIDYIEVHIFSYHFPIFNFADICLVVGFILVMLAIIKGEDKNES